MGKLRKGLPLAKEMGWFILGNFLYIVALQLFFVDNNIAAGGFGGIATLINHIVPVSIGNVVFIMNLPFVLIAFKVFGWKYTLKTFMATFIYAGFAHLMANFHAVTDDRFAASVFGGVVYGLASVCILNARASAGGTDLVARLLLKRFPNMSLGKMFLVVDGSCVILAILVYQDIEAGVYALTAIAVCSLVTDKIISGFDVADICYIITDDDAEAISDAVMREMQVGVTRQPAVGMYQKRARDVLMVVVRPREVHKLKKIVLGIDPDAFLVVGWASEVTGGGFRNSSESA